MLPSASATCSAVRSWNAASSASRRSSEASTRLALCTAAPAAAVPPSRASFRLRAERDAPVTGPASARLVPAFFTAR